MTTSTMTPGGWRRGAGHRGRDPLGAAEAELAELRARVAALETGKAKLETERDILRQAAEYFAGETNW